MKPRRAVDKWITAKVTAVTHLPTAPTMTTAAVSGSPTIGASAAPALTCPTGPIEPTHDQVGSFSMMTASAVCPLVGSFSMKKWARFA